MRPRRSVVVLCFLCLYVLPLQASRAQVIRRTIAPGVELVQEIVPPPDGPRVINVLRVDLRQKGVRVETAFGRDVLMADDPTKGRETVGGMAARHGAVAAVNADYFPYTGDPVGLAIRNGELVREGLAHRAAFGLTVDGRAIFGTLLCVGTLTASDGSVGALDGLNRPAGTNEVVLLTPTYGDRARVPSSQIVVPLSEMSLPIRPGQEIGGIAGQVSAGDPAMAIPAGGGVLAGAGSGGDWLRAHVHTGDSVRLRFDFVQNPLAAGPPRTELASRAGALRGRIAKCAWTDVTQAAGGGPWLVRNGLPAVDGVEEAFDPKSFVGARHPRTAVGATADGRILLVSVDGRQPHSRGMSLQELAACMVRLGAVNAINLDGGGSTTMVARNQYVNAPSDREPNAVAEALLVFADPDAVPAAQPTAGVQASERVDSSAAPAPQASAPAPAAPAPAAVTLSAGERVTVPAPEGTSNDQILWGTEEGTAFVSQAGVLTATRAGSGTVVARAGGRTWRIPFVVRPGSPVKLYAVFAASPNNPPDRKMLRIRVTDAYGNPIEAAAVRIQATGGVADTDEVKADRAGRAEVEVVWDAEKGGAVTVTCGSLRTDLRR